MSSERLLYRIYDFFTNLTLESIFYKILSMLIFGFLLSLYSYLPFVVYMSHNTFFSYDFFKDGLVALNIFNIFIVILISIMTILFTGGIPTYIIKKYYLHIEIKEELKIFFQINLVINNLYFSIAILVMLLDGFTMNRIIFAFGFLMYILVLTTSISTHIAIIVYCNFKIQFYSTITYPSSIYTTLIMFWGSKYTNNIVSSTLREFGVGGNLDIAVENLYNKK